jgi:hypothetical protein
LRYAAAGGARWLTIEAHADTTIGHAIHLGSDHGS